MDISADAAGRTGAGCRKRQRRTTQTHETKGTWLGTKKRTKKANEKTEYGYKRAARRGAEAVGRQALAERAASEAKFVLIAERKKQEEA